MKRSLKSRAYLEAASILENTMDAYDLPQDISEAEESEMREFIRVQVVKELRARAKSAYSPPEPRK